ncbi:hypothetical protein L3V82_06700 [Thiotrichales bacterium 19S3-7]|nr:hypothetical protein [Thiotrichales bacterium 19S3-7]MCF6801787.1 hypothetical protein [Thiotrichales bacterium 19S3-11]
MPIKLGQDKYQIVNLSTDLKKGDYVSSLGVIMGCSSFSVIGINHKGEYIGLFGHPSGGFVDQSQLIAFEDVIKNEGIRQLNIMDITLEEYSNYRVHEHDKRTANVRGWAENLMKKEYIDGYKMSSKVAQSPDFIQYTSSGITAYAGLIATPLKELPDIIKGDIKQIDHLNTIKKAKRADKPSIHTPLLDHEYDPSKSKQACCCVVQ